MSYSQFLTLLVVVFLVAALYREWFNPSLVFFASAMALLVGQVITPQELVKGLSNQQIIVIFLLVLVTAGLRSIFGSGLLTGLFHTGLQPKAFLLRMIVLTSSLSAFLNNTPIVAFLIPYVKDWSVKTGNPSSRFLIPLSFATILGGMVTVIGTSTNLVLNGLIAEYQLPLLNVTDFAYLGLLVTVMGWLYIYFVGYHLLPANREKMEAVRQNPKEYLVETEIFPGSKLIGKTVKAAGLRNLHDLFLVEINRRGEIISPVSPEAILEEGDFLFFSGATDSIYKLINEDNGLSIQRQDHLNNMSQFNFREAVIPSGSDLTGVRIKDSDFRNRFNASIVAIHRDGKRVDSKIGDHHLAGGDFLLLLVGESSSATSDKDLFFLSLPQKLGAKRPNWHFWIGVVAFGFLVLGIVGWLPLFSVCLSIILGMILLGILGMSEIRRNLDLGLLVVLVCSLAVGVALEKSGLASLVATLFIGLGKAWGPVAVLTLLFVATIFLTSVITNAAAVSIVFPISMAIAQQMQLPPTPFFVGIAFAASGDFMTPIGYQTNLMVYGPGGYTFLDFLKVGGPLTFAYSVVCITFISLYYQLI